MTIPQEQVNAALLAQAEMQLFAGVPGYPPPTRQQARDFLNWHDECYRALLSARDTLEQSLRKAEILQEFTKQLYQLAARTDPIQTALLGLQFLSEIETTEESE